MTPNDLTDDPSASQNPPGEDSKELSNYRVESRFDIVRILREIAQSTSTVTIYFNQGKETAVSTLIDVLPDKRLLILEKTANEELNKGLLQEKKIYLESKPLQVLVRFRVQQLSQAKYQGSPVFVAAIPDYIYRMQRREYFRINAPIINPIQCQIKPNGGNSIQLDLVDISVGGIGLNDPEHKIPSECRVGEPFPNSIIQIPKYGDVRTDLILRNIFNKVIHGKESRRIGFAYKKLTAGQMTAIQRYINQVQISQKAKERGMEPLRRGR